MNLYMCTGGYNKRITKNVTRSSGFDYIKTLYIEQCCGSIFIESGSRSRLFGESLWVFDEPGSGSNPGPGFFGDKNLKNSLQLKTFFDFFDQKIATYLFL
jgi:hypothetical protein